MKKTRSKKKFFLPLMVIPIIILVSIAGYFYRQGYTKCLNIGFSQCLNSQKYTSPSKQFSFRYPQGYPLTSKSGEARKIYSSDDKYDEWVNFSTEFYPNAGGDRLGSIVVYKKSEFRSVKEYAEKIQSDFNAQPERLKGNAPKIDFITLGNREAIRINTSQQPSSFALPSEEYIVIENGKLYSISFDYNDYYHKQSNEYYEESKQLILSTLEFS